MAAAAPSPAADRTRLINSIERIPDGAKSVLYWMSRDQRVRDNWALLHAYHVSVARRIPLLVCFCLVPKFLEATERQYGFMLKGLAQVEKDLASLRIPFHLLPGHAAHQLPTFVKDNGVGVVVTDFSPLRVPTQWVQDVGKALTIPLYQVDAHNIIPCWKASPKQETAARTFRPKVHDLLPHFLTEFPEIKEHPHGSPWQPQTDWDAADATLQIDRTVKEVAWAKPGERAAREMLESFLTKRLKNFSDDRNNPNKEGLSNLSPWFHFGQLAPQRAALEVKALSSKHGESVKAYLEESIVRRELSDNFCFYQRNYDSLDGAAGWARDTLQVHSVDKREFVYTREQLERGKTHDKLWNGAQLQMVRDGKMHGFMRMYWAKKILEWTATPAEALATAIYLNDKYELDGRDPNGYVGCMWSICGTHDMGWTERGVFGKIRFMNYNGCKRKFDVPAYEARHAKPLPASFFGPSTVTPSAAPAPAASSAPGAAADSPVEGTKIIRKKSATPAPAPAAAAAAAPIVKAPTAAAKRKAAAAAASAAEDESEDDDKASAAPASATASASKRAKPLATAAAKK